MSTASPPRWWRSSMAERASASASARPPPNAREPDFDWRRDRLSRPGQPRARPARGGGARPRSARCSTSSARAATTWRRSCSARRLTHRHDAACGYYRSRPDAARARRAARGRARLRHGPRRAAIRTGATSASVFNYPNPDGAPALADVRRRRRAIYADRGLGAGDRLSSATCSATRAYDGAIAVVLGGDASAAPPTASGRR